MDNIKISVALKISEQLINVGKCQEAYQHLAPLIDKGVPEALFLYSTFSIAEKESITEFEERSIRLLQLASQAGYAPAMYALAVCYDAGDIVGVDTKKAGSLYCAAAESGYPKAKLSHGLNLFYGSNGIAQDQNQGLIFIEQAATDGIEEATEVLREISETQL